MMKWSSIYSAYFKSYRQFKKLKTIVLKFILMSIFLKKMCFILGWKDLTCRIAHSLLTSSGSATVLPSFSHGLLR